MKKGTGCLTAFGGIFFLAGLGIFIWGLLSSVDVWRAQNWDVADAKINALELVSSTSDGSTSYTVKGSYEYLYQGKSYQSDQINFYSASDNIGSYHKDLHWKLQSAKNNQRPVKAYVNPDNPTESVLDRTMRWGMLGFQSIFLLVFGGVGLGIMLWGRWGAKQLAQNEALKQANHDEPWLWRKEWLDNNFKCRSKSTFKFLLFFAIVWNLISLPAAIAVLHEGNFAKEPLKLLVFLFPVIGLGMIVMTIVYYRRGKAFGGSSVVLEQTPLVIGGFSLGKVIINGDLNEREVMMTLSCQKVTRRRSGKETRTTTKILWQDDQRLLVEQHQARQFAVNFQIKIPEGLPESSNADVNNKIEWILKVEQKQKGPDLQLLFELPAFVVAHRLEVQTAEEDLFSEALSQESSEESMLSKGGDWRYLDIIESHSNYGKEYYFKPFRHKGLGVSTLVFGLLFLAIGIGIYMAESSLLFLIAFGGIGLLILLFGVNVILFRSRITTSAGALSCRKGALIAKKYRYSDVEIDDIVRSSNMSSGDKRYYHIFVKTVSGDQEVIAKYLLNSNDVDSFIEQLKKDIGLVC